MRGYCNGRFEDFTAEVLVFGCVLCRVEIAIALRAPKSFLQWKLLLEKCMFELKCFPKVLPQTMGITKV